MKPPYDFIYQNENVLNDLEHLLLLNKFKPSQLKVKQSKSFKITKKLIKKIKKGHSITEFFKDEE